mmetsp:Transcript_15933/g.39287  ORF Transcript_15933/g.39287 Transcript_15933/m.39287 type:complete len:98 (+) Transcript_15933:214-507(+)
MKLVFPDVCTKLFKASGARVSLSLPLSLPLHVSPTHSYLTYSLKPMCRRFNKEMPWTIKDAPRKLEWKVSTPINAAQAKQDPTKLHEYCKIGSTHSL